MATETPRPKKRLIRKFLVSVVLCCVALGIGGGAFVALSSLREPPAARQPTERIYNVEVFEVEPSDLQEIVTGFGTAKASREVVVSAQVAGEIIEKHPRMEVGELVQAPEIHVDPSGKSRRQGGDLLLRIDPEVYQERLTQIENGIREDDAELERLRQEEQNIVRLLEKARTDLEDYEREFKRIQGLARDGILHQSDLTRALLERRRYEEAVVRYENDRDLFPKRRRVIESRSETRRSERKLAQIDVERTDVRSPFSGIISDVTVEKGQFVRIGDPLFRLTDISRIEIAVALSLSDYPKIAEPLSSGEYPSVQLAENETAMHRWVGEVVRVAPEADELTRTIKIFVEVDNRDQAAPLLPGTFVHARIDGPVLRDAIVLPRDAITRDHVFVVANGESSDDKEHQIAASRDIALSRTIQSLAVIDLNNTRLALGDWVILTNLDVLRDGAKLQIQAKRRLADELARQRVKMARRLSITGASSQRHPSSESTGQPM